MTLSNEERKALYAFLSNNPDRNDPAQAEDIARTILLSDLDRLTEDVRREIVNIQASQKRDAEIRQRMYYPFIAPAENGGKPKLVESTENIDFYEKPQRVPYKVRAMDLAAFCKEHGLREREMVRVGMGEIEEHRGWTRTWDMGPMTLGIPYRKPRPEQPKPTGPKEHRFVFRWAPKTVDWAPGQDK